MKALSQFIVLVLIVFWVTLALADGDKAMSPRMFYEDAIDNEIAQSRQMASLMSSRSANLRKKGHHEASMAMFLEIHRDQLVDKMIAHDLELKIYKVERFLNERFNCDCYATWASIGEGQL